MQTLWKEVLEKKLDDIPVEDAPIIEIDLDKPGANVDEESRYGDCGSEKTVKSKTNPLKMLPSFVGEYEVKSDVHKIPSQYKPKPTILDMTNLHALLSTQVKITLPLADVLKIKPELWKEVLDCLKKMGILVPMHMTTMDGITQSKKDDKIKSEPVPLNKVGDYCEGEDGNTTLPVEYNGHKNLAILDSGAGIAIVTKQVWELGVVLPYKKHD